MNDWDYLMTMVRLRQMAKGKWKMPILPLCWMDASGKVTPFVPETDKEERKP